MVKAIKGFLVAVESGQEERRFPDVVSLVHQRGIEGGDAVAHRGASHGGGDVERSVASIILNANHSSNLVLVSTTTDEAH